MSSAPLYNFVVFAPDSTDAGAFERRMAVRPKHLEKAHEAIAKGIIQFGGAFLTPESIASPTAEKKLVGSTMLIRASSFEEAKSIIESDVYWTNNVWDHEKLFIAPFLVATPDSFKI